MEVTKNLKIKSFLGVPIILKNGDMFATLCAIDTKPYTFTDENILLLQSMASFLAYVIELERTEDLYRQLVEMSPDGILVQSEGKIVYINPAGGALFGAPSQELIGKLTSDLIKQNDDDDTKETRDIYEQRLVRFDGEWMNVETTENSLSYQGKPATQFMIRDISDRKLMEDALRKSEKLSVVGQLAAGVAHEIRNPLTAVRGFIQLLQSKNEDNRKYCEFILSEIDRINFIVNEFLLLAKPQKIIFRLRDPRDLLKNVITLLETQAIIKNIEIVTQFPSDLPLIECEENQIKQVFVNILKNAIEAMSSGGKITIQVRMLQPDKLLFRFIDEGSGIPEDRLFKLGEPFYTTKEKGTGLGLMMSYKIIEETHQGTMKISSEMNKGTTVEIVLPIAP
jgi:two-component system sporulation sensor kinase A